MDYISYKLYYTLNMYMLFYYFSDINNKGKSQVYIKKDPLTHNYYFNMVVSFWEDCFKAGLSTSRLSPKYILFFSALVKYRNFSVLHGERRTNVHYIPYAKLNTYLLVNFPEFPFSGATHIIFLLYSPTSAPTASSAILSLSFFFLIDFSIPTFSERIIMLYIF